MGGGRRSKRRLREAPGLRCGGRAAQVLLCSSTGGHTEARGRLSFAGARTTTVLPRGLTLILSVSSSGFWRTGFHVLGLPARSSGFHTCFTVTTGFGSLSCRSSLTMTCGAAGQGSEVEASERAVVKVAAMVEAAMEAATVAVVSMVAERAVGMLAWGVGGGDGGGDGGSGLGGGDDAGGPGLGWRARGQ